MIKPSPVMKKVLDYLNQTQGARFCAHYHGDSLYYITISHVNKDGSQHYRYCPIRRLTISTYRALKKRGWIEFDRRRESGGTMGTLSDGTQGIVIPSYSLDYKISEEGREVLR